MAQLISHMADRHRVALLYFRGLGEPPLDESLRERCELAVEVLRPWTGWSLVERWFRRARLVASLFRRRPLWVTDWSSRAYAARVRQLVETWRPDLVQIEYHIMAQYVAALDSYPAPRLLTEHEPAVLAAPYLRSSVGGLTGFLDRLDKQLWRVFESAILQAVQAVVVFTEIDRQSVERLKPKAQIVTIPLGTEIPETPQSPVGCRPHSLLFLGNFMHPPNVDAAMRLARGIFPIAQAQYPELELYIVGDQPPARLQAMASDKILITGRVPDITPYLDRAALFVAPLRMGGGMRVKVLEALAAGKAVVASPRAVQGLDLSDGEQIALAESDEEFGRLIVQLLGNPEKLRSIATQARAWACANLGWEKSVVAYEELYTRLIGRSALKNTDFAKSY